MQNKAFSTKKTLRAGGRLIDFEAPRIMGILNVTPDSFYDGNRYTDPVSIEQRAEEMAQQGATFIDIGGYSSRPGADDVPEEEELRRVLPAIRVVAKKIPSLLISIDTFRSAVAHAAVSEGAAIVNDISGGSADPRMFETVGSLRVPYILMHMRGNPQTMTSLATYDDLLNELLDFFAARVHQLQETGIHDIVIDPGFGFAKTREQNFELLEKLRLLSVLGRPILAGLSRKSMVWKTLGVKPGDSLNGTTVLNTVAVLNGADILRVHDVREAAELVRLTAALRQNVSGVDT